MRQLRRLPTRISLRNRLHLDLDVHDLPRPKRPFAVSRKMPRTLRKRRPNRHFILRPEGQLHGRLHYFIDADLEQELEAAAMETVFRLPAKTKDWEWRFIRPLPQPCPRS